MTEIRTTLMQIIDNLPIPCILRNEECVMVYSNKAAESMFSSDGEFTGDCEEFSPPFQPDGSPSMRKYRVLIRHILDQGQPIKLEWLYCRRDKELIPSEITLMRVELGGEPHILEFLQDLRESHQTRIAEREIRQRLQVMMDSCPVTCGIVDIHFNVLEVNNVVMSLFGILNKQTFLNRFFELSPEYQPDGQLSRRKALDKLKQAFESGRIHYEWLHQSIYGEQIPCEVTLVRVKLNNQNMAIIYIHDLREIKKSIAMMEKMESIAYSDELTGLFSRRYFVEKATPALERAKANDETFHLIMADLDHFKAVNDTYGHPIGDEVLKITAKRMTGVTRQGSIIARYGGEEFIVLLSNMTHDAALKTAQRIQKSMEESAITIKGMSLNVTVSLGLASFSDPSESLDDIIHKADVALYGAKRTGRNKVMEYENAKDLTW
ncbi:MAG: diguanylate cyclase [Defluviitaleaceae bacterium]|nr:diguanylate cyclase [Defluviitaleaceae bacterium]